MFYVNIVTAKHLNSSFKLRGGKKHGYTDQIIIQNIYRQSLNIFILQNSYYDLCVFCDNPVTSIGEKKIF